MALITGLPRAVKLNGQYLFIHFGEERHCESKVRVLAKVLESRAPYSAANKRFASRIGSTLNSFPMFMIFCKPLEETMLFLWLYIRAVRDMDTHWDLAFNTNNETLS